MNLKRWLLSCASGLALYARADRVESLPDIGPTPTAHYSGFVEVDAASKTNLFYYLVESQSSPSSDPLIWWMNGGPGASSLVGLFSENGPMLLNEAGQWVSNPYAWNRNANVLYVEFGPGIGFSFCANSSRTDDGLACKQEQSDCSPCDASDSSVAQHNAYLLEKLLTDAFPKLKGRPLYIAGESYAGVYIPTLAAEISKRFKDTSIVNLHGMWVTDPCTDNKAQFGRLDINPDFCYEKGLISKEVQQALTDPAKGCFSERTSVGDRIRRTDSTECKKAWRLYDLATAGVGGAVHPNQPPGLPMYIDPLNAFGFASPGGDVPGYLTRDDVRKAIYATASPNKVYHIELGNNGYSNYRLEYSACNLNVPKGAKSMIDIYRTLATAGPSVKSLSNLQRIIVSSGDIDPVVNLHGTEVAVNAIGFPVAHGGDRRPWFFNATGTPKEMLEKKPVAFGPSLRALDAGMQVGGFVTNFETGVKGRSLDFVTVRNSGHMVPAYAPQQAIHVIQSSLLQGKELSPLLPSDWDTADDQTFYGTKTSGEMAKWVHDAMAGPVKESSSTEKIAIV